MSRSARHLQDDPISAASTGLIELGIDRSRRMDALEVLGCLIDHADSAGNVVLDRELVSQEETLGVDKCLEAYTLLERLDVVTRTDRGWSIANFHLHQGPVAETAASLAILRKHMVAPNVEIVFEAAPKKPAVAPLHRWRRAVPVAAGIAASAAALVGATQLLPQAAVSGRNAAHSADSPTSVVRRALEATTRATTEKAQPRSTVASTATSALATTPPSNGAAPLACLLPQVLATVDSVDVVQVPLGGKNGQTIWTAVVKGTATLTNTDKTLLLPTLNVVAHLADGDSEAVPATLTTRLLTPNQAAPFNAVVALSARKPTGPVTATAAASGIESC